jgi:hypothetical protein
MPVAADDAATTASLNVGEPPRSPLFAGIVERLHAADRPVVLDLGPARSRMIDLLQPRRARLYVADLPAWLAASADETEDPRFEAALPPAVDERPLDMVLCWDLWNYLSLPGLAALMARIEARCHPGTLVHALFMYTHRQLPASPSTYLPCEDGRLECLASTTSLRPAPRYSSEQLSEAMPGFRTEKVLLLHTGMQELLLERRR